MLINSFTLLTSGNAVGIAVSLCVVAVWCFLRQRFVPFGVLCLALSLMIKPHDGGLAWLYFLLAGGALRRRALQVLVTVLLMSALMVGWITSVAPNWVRELQSNLAFIMGPSGLGNPGPSSLSTHTAGVIIDLQTVISVFRDDPAFYNPIAYAIFGVPLLAWLVITWRTKLSPAGTWLSLATIAPLTMLATYHRTYDAKLLMLTVPACALLWKQGGFIKWASFGLTTAAIVISGDLPLIVLAELTKAATIPDTFFGKIGAVILTRPVPLILFALALFYLWVYFKHSHNGIASDAGASLDDLAASTSVASSMPQ